VDKAKVNNIEIEYEVSGTGEPVLLISPVLADGFVPLIEEGSLAERYQLIRYHKRGWAGSTHPDGAVSVEDHAADAAALLDHLGIPRAHVAGHSSGAAVAAQLALDDLDRVHTLTLLELSLLSVPAGQAFLDQAAPALEAYATGHHEDALAMFLTAVSGMPWDECRTLLESRMPGTVVQAVKDAKTFFEVELPGLAQWTFGDTEAAQIRRPTLSILGSDTAPLWVEVAEFLRTKTPYVEERTIIGVGHLLHLQQPAPVASAIAEFLDGNPLATQDDNGPHA
jgi:pimeloyl-ACP methyl ester carboxylesterase